MTFNLKVSSFTPFFFHKNRFGQFLSAYFLFWEILNLKNPVCRLPAVILNFFILIAMFRPLTAGLHQATFTLYIHHQRWTRTGHVFYILSSVPLSFVCWDPGAVCMKYKRAAYKLALTRCSPPPDRSTVSISPFKIATDGPTGRELPLAAWCRGLPPPVPSRTGKDVAKEESRDIVHWRRWARRERRTPDTGDVSSGNASSSAI